MLSSLFPSLFPPVPPPNDEPVPEKIEELTEHFRKKSLPQLYQWYNHFRSRFFKYHEHLVYLADVIDEKEAQIAAEKQKNQNQTLQSSTEKKSAGSFTGRLKESFSKIGGFSGGSKDKQSSAKSAQLERESLNSSLLEREDSSSPEQYGDGPSNKEKYQ